MGLTVNALVNMEISLNSSAILFLDDKNQVLCVATPKSEQQASVDQPGQQLMLTSVTNGKSLPVDLQFTSYSQVMTGNVYLIPRSNSIVIATDGLFFYLDPSTL